MCLFCKILGKPTTENNQNTVVKRSGTLNGSIDTDSSSLTSGRRPSVDTVSTYLSQCSLQSQNKCNSVSDLLDCSIGSDDVFVLPNRNDSNSVVGTDPASDVISKFVKMVDSNNWTTAQPCPVCLMDLRLSVNAPMISLTRCKHVMHLHCLNDMIKNLQLTEHRNLYIECPVCGIVYGEKYGNQPTGKISWSIIPQSLPGHENQHTIQIVYE